MAIELKEDVHYVRIQLDGDESPRTLLTMKGAKEIADAMRVAEEQEPPLCGLTPDQVRLLVNAGVACCVKAGVVNDVSLTGPQILLALSDLFAWISNQHSATPVKPALGLVEMSGGCVTAVTSPDGVQIRTIDWDEFGDSPSELDVELIREAMLGGAELVPYHVRSRYQPGLNGKWIITSRDEDDEISFLLFDTELEAQGWIDKYILQKGSEAAGLKCTQSESTA